MRQYRNQDIEKWNTGYYRDPLHYPPYPYWFLRGLNPLPQYLHISFDSHFYPADGDSNFLENGEPVYKTA
jgi:hypothetical protein